MCMSKCGCGCGRGCGVGMIAKWLLVIGGLNWGLVGAGMLAGNGDEWNLVSMLLGAWPAVEAIVYVLVGVAALLKAFGCPCKKCREACASCAVEEVKTGGGMQ